MATHANSTPAPAFPPGAINRASLARLRAEVSARVDRLISVLDALDGDPDLEDDLDTHETDTLDEHGELGDDNGIADRDGMAEQFGGMLWFGEAAI